MSVLTIRKFDDQVLKQVAVPVEDIDDNLRELLEKMAATMYGSRGVGLSGPQVGDNRRICVVDLGYVNGQDYGSNHIAMINPIIIQASDETTKADEGCLSFPGFSQVVESPNEITVEYLTIDGEKLQEKFEGWSARIVRHECLPHNSKIHTEDGIKTIKEIVDSQYKGGVLCLDKDNNLCYSKVIGWGVKGNGVRQYRAPSKDKKVWVSLKSSETGANKQLLCTEEHPCAFIQDILRPEIEYLPAICGKEKFLVRRPFARERNSEHCLYNQEQISIIIGSLLGDGCISSRGGLSYNHGEPQEEYAKHKAEILQGSVGRGYSGYRKAYTNFSVACQITEQTKVLRKLLYTPNKKAVNFGEVIDLITPISLAFWYMDDGSLFRDKYAYLHTEGFSEEGVQFLIDEVLLGKFKIKASKCKRAVRGVEKYCIAISKKREAAKLFSLISKYIHPSMQYKLPNKYRKNILHQIDSTRRGYSAKFIEEVRAKPKFESQLYDIRVESGCFFANDSLVHNCDHLDGVTLLSRASNFKRSRYMKKINKMRKQYVQMYGM